jgi:peroxiredoxin
MTHRDWFSVLLAIAGFVVLTVAIFMPPSNGHPVSVFMEDAAKSVIGRSVTQQAEATDGQTYSLIDMSIDRPLVLIFILDGCSCSESAEPYFQKLHQVYGSRVHFLGVINGDRTMANDWMVRQGTPFPILCDPNLKIVRECGVVRSAYVALIAPGGTIEELWPGYSSTMLTELGAKLAQYSKLPEVPIDTSGAPTRMTSGCPY